MTILEGIKKIVTGQNKPIDMWHYIVGNYRYRLFYSKGVKKAYNSRHSLMRQHIWEQVVYRIQEMDKECYRNGQCKHCGCATTNLQMASKRCEGICYPTMMGKEDWKRYKMGGIFIEKDGAWITRKMPGNELVSKHIFYKNGTKFPK